MSTHVRAGIAGLVISLVIPLANCKLPPKSTAQPSDDLPVDVARQLSDAVAQELLNQRGDAIRAKAERFVREQVDERAFASTLDGIYEAYGTPLEFEFKDAARGTKQYPDRRVKSMWKFWYAARTSKFEKGDYFLFVEVVKDEGNAALSSFAIVRFTGELPPNLR